VMCSEKLGMRGRPRSGTRRSAGMTRRPRWRLSDERWAQFEGLLGDPPRRGAGRPRYPARACLEGVLYVLYTDTPWTEVPYRELGLPSGETCRRRLEEWQRRGVLEAVFVQLRGQLHSLQRLDLTRVIVDASLVEAKKGARRSRARCAPATAAATT
jgi:transposase